MNPEIQALQQEIHNLKARLDSFERGSHFLFTKNIEIPREIGTKFGLDAYSKIGFYGAAPVVQASAIAAPSTPGVAYDQSQAQSAVDAINFIRTALKNFGITA